MRFSLLKSKTETFVDSTVTISGLQVWLQGVAKQSVRGTSSWIFNTAEWNSVKTLCRVWVRACPIQILHCRSSLVTTKLQVPILFLCFVSYSAPSKTLIWNTENYSSPVLSGSITSWKKWQKTMMFLNFSWHPCVLGRGSCWTSYHFSLCWGPKTILVVMTTLI